jgi:hypothetical protein
VSATAMSVGTLRPADSGPARLGEQVISRDELEEGLDELYWLAADSMTLMTLPRIFQSWGWRAPSARSG